MPETIPEFTIKPRGDRKIKPKWNNKSVEFESGKQQVHGITTSPIYFWELRFVGTIDTAIALENFFNDRCGTRKRFYWKDSNNVTHLVRFAQDELDMVHKWGFTENGYEPVAFECSVLLREVQP